MHTYLDLSYFKALCTKKQDFYSLVLSLIVRVSVNVFTGPQHNLHVI